MSTLSSSTTTWLPASFLPNDYLALKGVTAGLSIVTLLLFFLFPRSKTPPGYRIPNYVLLEGYAVAQLLMQGPWTRKLADLFLRRGQFPVYGFTSTHRVLSSPALAASVLRRPHALVHNDTAQWALQVRVFGTQEHLRTRVQAIFEQLFAAVSKHMLQESHARNLVHRTYDLLRSLVPNLTAAPAQWLLNANLTSNADGSVDADLYELVRDFVTHVSIRMLAGTDFLNAYPAISTDLFALDGAFTLLALGVPTWMPLSIMRDAVAARKRMLTEISALAERLEAVAMTSADKQLQARMRDVNGVFWERSAVYREAGLSIKDRGSLDLALFWAMNANTSPFVFWVVAYIYADKSLLVRLRAELDPLIDVSAAEAGKPAVVNRLDADGILSRCPVLKATYLESFRLAHEPTSLRCVQQDLSIPDPSLPKDAPPLLLRQGTFVTVPHTVQQFDDSLYPDPNEFRSDRFLSEKDGEVKVGYGSLKPWGDGSSICKGRTFAEREVLVAVATIVRLWDMEAVDGTWKLPSKIPGTGVVKPATKLRVRLRPRI